MLVLIYDVQSINVWENLLTDIYEEADSNSFSVSKLIVMSDCDERKDFIFWLDELRSYTSSRF